MYKVVLGLKFFHKVNAFRIPKEKSLVIIDTIMKRVIPLKLMERTKPVLSALQLERGLKNGVLMRPQRDLGDGDGLTSPKEIILEPMKLSKKPLSRYKTDEAIEPKPGARPFIMTPRCSTPLAVNLFQSDLLNRVQHTRLYHNLKANARSISKGI